MELAMLLDGESISTVPEQKEYENIIVDCGDSATGKWDTENWGALVTNMTAPKVKCSINFIRKDYQEDILNGTDPVLADSLIPVKISDDGTVTKANIKEEWYNYTDKIWANAVILEDETKTYKNGEVIPESNIESYFVWIPRYKYKIWDEGKYTSPTTIDVNKVHTIQVEFETKDVAHSNGSTVGSWLTHPAFTSFNTNGMWVGKFESGYKGAKTTAAAEKNEATPDKLQIKPNVYSWRWIQLANAHLTSYNYKRELDSHMMKNTEWGAVAYLQHSAYGSQTSVRLNNNSAYITGYAAKNEPTIGYTGTNEEGNIYESTNIGVNGANTFMYNTDTGYLASTTGNINGIYDMSGGAWEYIMGVISDQESHPKSGPSNVQNSGFKVLWNDEVAKEIEWPDAKYYDLYSYVSNIYAYKNRILGDATGEMGPFANREYLSQNRPNSSWYTDAAFFVTPSLVWFVRGGNYAHGCESGIFNFGNGNGESQSGQANTYSTFRTVLSPQ